MIGRVPGRLGAMNSDERTAGRGPDDMGDDEQETELAEYKQYIEDPPANFAITEDNDDDANQAQDWADRHPKQVAEPADDNDKPAEESAIHEILDR
jgi:hypothetical protein